MSNSLSNTQRAVLLFAGAAVAFSAGLFAAEDDATGKGPPAKPTFDGAEDLLNSGEAKKKSAEDAAEGEEKSSAERAEAAEAAEAALLNGAKKDVFDEGGGKTAAPEDVEESASESAALPEGIDDPSKDSASKMEETKENRAYPEQEAEEKIAFIDEDSADVMPKARPYDRDMTDTKYQCSPPSLSPHSLLKELTRQANRNQRERESIERLTNDLDERRLAMHEEIERLEKKIKEFAAAKEDLPPKPLSKEEKEAQKKKDNDVKANKELLARQRAEEKRREKEKRVREKAAQVAQLAKAMRGMQAPEAAVFLSSLETDLAADVLKGMRPKDAGAALAKMSPRIAAKLATRFTTRKALPVEEAP
ncbi:MAG: hypothetical protein GY822_15460 [Deltaproteobacteria bacterium]|nr:hypothetical protein [Deltaproteobacteria bacterium]